MKTRMVDRRSRPQFTIDKWSSRNLKVYHTKQTMLEGKQENESCSTKKKKKRGLSSSPPSSCACNEKSLIQRSKSACLANKIIASSHSQLKRVNQEKKFAIQSCPVPSFPRWFKQVGNVILLVLDLQVDVKRDLPKQIPILNEVSPLSELN